MVKLIGLATDLFNSGLLPVPKQGLPVEGVEQSDPEVAAACAEAGLDKVKALNNATTAKTEEIPRFISDSQQRYTNYLLLLRTHFIRSK